MLLSEVRGLMTVSAGFEEHVLPLGHNFLVEPPILTDHSGVDVNSLVNVDVEKSSTEVYVE